MVNPHLVVIDPAVKKAELQAFNRMVTRSPLPMTYHLPALFGWESLATDETPDSVKGIIILGSGSSVWDRFPWQEALEKWLQPLMLQGIPTLGLCYGHQLIAHLFGAKVAMAFDDQHKAIGLRDINLSASRLWGPPRQGSLVVSHREGVISPPADFKTVGTSQTVNIEALEHKSLPIWSFQSHPEACASFLLDQNVSLSSRDLEFGHSLIDSFLAFAAT